MQQPRLVAARALNLLRRTILTQNVIIRQRASPLASSATAGRPGDPEVFSEEPEPHGPHGQAQESMEHYQPDTEKRQPEKDAEASGYQLSKEANPLHSPEPPQPSSPRLQNVGVRNPVEPINQQKRRSSALALDDITCAGLDGSPWPKEQERESDAKREKRGEEEEDNKEYFKHHKASPLSEIQLADTRKPITRATDGTAGSGGTYGGGRDVVGWLPEQLDTAEEALERARRIWWENATRGDADSPHGRVLRVLRGEWF